MGGSQAFETRLEYLRLDRAVRSLTAGVDVYPSRSMNARRQRLFVVADTPSQWLTNSSGAGDSARTRFLARAAAGGRPRPATRSTPPRCWGREEDVE